MSRTTTPRGRSNPAIRAAILAALVHLSAPGRLKAENRVDYRYEDYVEDDNRIRVRTHSVFAEQALNSKVVAKGNFVYDGISGSSPTGANPSLGSTQVPLQYLEDIRRAGYVEAAITTGRFITRPQVSYSEESDYESIGISINESIEFNDKNTTLSVGLARNFDRVTGFWLSRNSDWRDKDTWDVLVGVTQILNAKTYLTANLTVGVADGYLTDPYKGVHFRYDFPVDGYNADPTAAIAERRPDQRVKEVVFLGITHFITPLKASVDANYRFHNDDWGIQAHTLTATWNQKVGSRITISPLLRYHRQSAADFFSPTFNGTLLDPNGIQAALQSDGFTILFDGDAGFPGDGTPFSIPAWPRSFSSDYRLSELETYTAGVGIRWEITDNVSVDLAYKRYEMRGLDAAVWDSAFPNAHVYTVGMGFRW